MSGTKKKPSKKTICIIVAIVLLLGIIGSCNDSLKDKNKEPQTTVSSTTVITTTSKPTTITTTKAMTEATTAEETEPEREIVHTQASYDYIVNTNTGKFHYSSCSQANRIKEENKTVIHGTSDELKSMGYTPCSKCNP